MLLIPCTVENCEQVAVEISKYNKHVYACIFFAGVMLFGPDEEKLLKIYTKNGARELILPPKD